jgi:hypothetical protein
VNHEGEPVRVAVNYSPKTKEEKPIEVVRVVEKVRPEERLIQRVHVIAESDQKAERNGGNPQAAIPPDDTSDIQSERPDWLSPLVARRGQRRDVMDALRPVLRDGPDVPAQRAAVVVDSRDLTDAFDQARGIGPTAWTGLVGHREPLEGLPEPYTFRRLSRNTRA